MSVNKLAKMLDCYPNSIHQWLKSETQPNDSYIRKMAEIFAVEPEYIWSGRNPITDEADEHAKKYAELSERDQRVIDSVMDSLADATLDKNRECN